MVIEIITTVAKLPAPGKTIYKIDENLIAGTKVLITVNNETIDLSKFLTTITGRLEVKLTANTK
jgi:hypothetical protein